jgi:hypothetical protein
MLISQTGIDIFLQMANHLQDSNSEPNQVWKWDLQPICQRVFLLASCFFRLAKNLWNQGSWNILWEAIKAEIENE